MSILLPLMGLSAVKAGIGAYAQHQQNKASHPAWLSEFLRNEATKRDTTGFLPDRSAYDQSANAGIASVLEQLPVGMEQFNAQAASRGVFNSGESMKHLYSDVVSPIFTSAANISAQSNLAYTQAYQQGSIAAENIRQGAINRLTGYTTGRTSATAAGLGNLGADAAQGSQYLQMLAMMQMFGGGGAK